MDADHAAQIEELKLKCAKGKLLQVWKASLRCGLSAEEVMPFFHGVMRDLHTQKRVNELLSFLFNTQIESPWPIPDLLRLLYQLKDHPGFLKQAYRFEATDGLEKEIENSITFLEQHNQIGSAVAYRFKFNCLRNKTPAYFVDREENPPGGGGKLTEDRTEMSLLGWMLYLLHSPVQLMPSLSRRLRLFKGRSPVNDQQRVLN